MRFRTALLILALAFGTISTVVLAPSPAYAQTEQKLEKALEQAIEDYDLLEIQSAQKKLEDAIELAEDEEASGEIVGRLYIMLGVVQFAGTRDEATVEESFVRALEADPAADIPDVYRTPDLDDILSRAQEKAGTPEPDRPPSTAGITHQALTDVDASTPVLFEAFVPRDMPVYKMFVFFRIMGEESWKKVEMQPTNAERFAVQVEGGEFTSSQFDYYIAAHDRGGNTIDSSGSPEEPHNVVVLGSSDGGTDGGGKDGDGKDGEGKDGDERIPTERDSIAYVSLLGGTSPGILTGADNNIPTANPARDVSPGLAIAFGHAMLDAGVTITERMHLGLFFRYQFAPPQDFSNLAGSPSVAPGNGFWDTKQECLGLGLPGDCILGLKYKLFFSDTNKLRIYSSFGTGVGRTRNWLRLKQPVDTARGRCDGKPTFTETTSLDGQTQTVEFCYIRDTVRTGWLHFGVGGGLAVPLTDNMDLVGDAYLMVLAPTTSINLDLSGGIALRF
jgi:hypothetical protein